MFWLYTQQLTCDEISPGCYVNISVHPEDRFAGRYDPGIPQDSVVIVGIDDASMQTLHSFPLSRDVYAHALDQLEADGAATVAFDVAFPDPGNDAADNGFHDALAASKVPVVLAYGAGKLDTPGAIPVQGGRVDEIPIRKFRCLDTAGPVNGPCAQPMPNVVLASPDLVLDRDGVVRRMPLAVQPLCYAARTCSTPF